MGYLSELDRQIRTQHGIRQDREIPQYLINKYLPNLTEHMSDVGSIFVHHAELYEPEVSKLKPGQIIPTFVQGDE